MRRRRDRTPLGPNFARLWASSTVADLGDGVALAAGPLLMATLTNDPGLVGGALFVQQLPWLLLSLPAGAIVDRMDRRRLIIAMNLVRAVIVGALAVTVITGTASVPIVYAALFLLGTAETVVDNAATAMVPGVVGHAGLATATSRIMLGKMVGNHMVAPPIGALLFAVAVALPFGVNAALYVASTLFLIGMRGAHADQPAEPQPTTRMRAEIAEGVRWLWAHSALRMLTLTLFAMNVTFFGVMAILVLYARDLLGLGTAGYGLLLSASAVGGVVGALLAPRLELRFGAALLLRIGVGIEALTHVGLALTRSPVVAVAILVLFGVHCGVWDVIIMTIRQRAVPDALRGRVNSCFFLFVIGGSALGALQGGLLARTFGLTTPFWFAGGLMLVLAVFVWRIFTPAALAAEQATDREGPPTEVDRIGQTDRP